MMINSHHSHQSQQQQQQLNNNNNSTTNNDNSSNIAVIFDLEAQRVIANPSSATQIAAAQSQMPSGTTTAAENSGNKPYRWDAYHQQYAMGRFPVAEVLTNFALILIAGLITESVLRLIGPYQRGFFCDDDSIRLPYKTPSVPVWLLLLYCLLLPAISFSFGEHCRLTNPKTASEQISKYEANEKRMARLLIRCTFFQGYFLIALMATLIFTSMAKFPVGRLRPHFIDLCKPSINNQTDFCVQPTNEHAYVDVRDYTCTGGTAFQIAEARLSFFSGHSSFAMCTAIFISIYLHARLGPLFRYVVIVPLLQIAVLSSAMLIAYSRIQDHMHHWSDVLIGMTTGSSVASFVAFNIVGFSLKSRRLGGEFLRLGAANEESTTTTSNNNGIVVDDERIE